MNAVVSGDIQHPREWLRLERLAGHAETVAEAAAAKGIVDPTERLMGGLGVYFSARADYRRAERLSRARLASAERGRGKDHPNVAIHSSNLAELLRIINRLAEAEPLMRRALSIDEAFLGARHPSVARDLNNLAQLLQVTDRLTEAELLMRRAVHIDEAGYGPDHPGLAMYRANLAVLLRVPHRPTEAETLLRRAVVIYFRSDAANRHAHPHRDAALRHYTRLLTEMGDAPDTIQAKIAAARAEAGLT